MSLRESRSNITGTSLMDQRTQLAIQNMNNSIHGFLHRACFLLCQAPVSSDSTELIESITADLANSQDENVRAIAHSINQDDIYLPSVEVDESNEEMLTQEFQARLESLEETVEMIRTSILGDRRLAVECAQRYLREGMDTIAKLETPRQN